MRALIFYLAEETTRQTDSRSIPCDGRFSSNIPECKSAICNLILQALCRVIYQFFDAVGARNLLGRNIDSLRLQWVQHSAVVTPTAQFFPIVSFPQPLLSVLCNVFKAMQCF